MMAVIRDAGVTSKAGLSTSTPFVATAGPPNREVTSRLLRCSMGIYSPVGVARSIVLCGAAT